MGGAEAVRPGVTAADDDDVLARGEDLVAHLTPERDDVALREVVHRLVGADELAPGDRQLAGHGGPDREHDGVVTVLELGARHLGADVDPVAEPGALGLHLRETPVQDGLLHLELRYAVAQQPAGLVGPLVDRHRVPGPGQLLGRRQTGRTGADDRNGLARQSLRRLGRDLAGVEGLLDGRDLDLLDRHRGLVDAQHAGRLARSRAEPTGELREVVRGMELLDGLAPVTLPREVVPLGNEVAKGTTVVTERDPAVHAPTGLALELPELLLLVDLFPVHETHGDRTTGRELPVAHLEKALGVRHGKPP